jgi:hypothetical protein
VALATGVAALAELQDKLYALDKWAVLLIFQAMVAAGKDGAIKYIISGRESPSLQGLVVQGVVTGLWLVGLYGRCPLPAARPGFTCWRARSDALYP